MNQLTKDHHLNLNYSASSSTSSILDTYEYGNISSSDCDETLEREISLESIEYDSDKDPEYFPFKKQNFNDLILEIEDVLPSVETEEQNQSGSKTKKRKITPKKKLTRKQTRNIEEWIDVKAKTKLNFGEEHLNRSGKLKKAKKMGQPCNSTCRLKCVNNVSDEIRRKLFNDYRKLGDHGRQWDFIARYVKVSEKKVGSVTSRRKFSRKYFFPITNNNTEIQVCRSMFLRTFPISEKVVHTVCSKLENSPTLMADGRGKHTNRPAK